MNTNKLNNLDETDKFLETHNLPRPMHEEKENQDKPITNKEIELVIKNLPTKPFRASLGNSTKHLKKN